MSIDQASQATTNFQQTEVVYKRKNKQIFVRVMIVWCTCHIQVLPVKKLT